MVWVKALCLFVVISFGIQVGLEVMVALKNPAAKVGEWGVIIFSAALSVLLALCGVFG
jgi:hypothetical protein